MPSAFREQQLLDALWERVRDLIPPKPPHPRGGRPFAPDYDCLAGLVYLLRNGSRWNALPGEFPSDTTCWRRHRDWVNAGIWDRIHAAILEELQDAGLLDTSELAIDATLRGGAKRGDEIGPTKCGVGMKLESATDANFMPLAVVTAAANGSEIVLGAAALRSIPSGIEVPDGVPVPADKGYDSDPLREQLAGEGFELLSPHRSNRVKPPTNDGRTMRRYKVERTFAWLQSFRRVGTRFEKTAKLYDGFVCMAVALVYLGELMSEVAK